MSQPKDKSFAIIRRVLLRAPHVPGCPGRSLASACSCGIRVAVNSLAALADELALGLIPPEVDPAPASCVFCRQETAISGQDGLTLCEKCRAVLPYLLVKAAAVKGSYSALLKAGATVAGFVSLSFSSIPGWVLLHEPGGCFVEVMVSQIVMVSDDSKSGEVEKILRPLLDRYPV
jgi:hypothetical protein